MRFVVYGVGAVGGVLAAALASTGHSVVGIARSAQLQALQDGPLTLHSPAGTLAVDIETVSHPSAITFGDGDVVLTTLKSQHTEQARRDLAPHAPPGTIVVCMQNGVANERTLSRSFDKVYGAVVMMPATFVTPGEVSVYGQPRIGTIDVGCYPGGSDEIAAAVSGALVDAGFDSRPIEDVMRWKYGKLIGNLTNAIEAVCGLGTRNGELGQLLTNEGEAVLAAAGIAYATESDEDERRAGNVELREVGGVARQGASSWQSLHRATGSIETDFLNGEIALLGRQHGVPTPANRVIQRLANEVARSGQPPGAIPESEVLSQVEIMSKNTESRSPAGSQGAV